MTIETFINFVNAYIVPLGWKLIGAVAAWIIGGWLAWSRNL